MALGDLVGFVVDGSITVHLGVEEIAFVDFDAVVEEESAITVDVVFLEVAFVGAILCTIDSLSVFKTL
jgi:hypothetical protein